VHSLTGRIDSAEMILLFEDLQARHPTATAIRVVLDNARYNHSRELKAWLACDECRVELIHLPAYAPNLNLIERFWWLFTKEAIYNEYFSTFTGFRAAVEGFFARLARRPGKDGSMAVSETSYSLADVLRDTIVALVRQDGPDLSARQFGVFLTCYLESDAQTVRGLADALEVAKPVITRALDRLTEFDLVRRKPDPTDRRSALVQRTPTGTAYLRCCVDGWRRSPFPEGPADA
jgi:DNA-binding MarR family transcriptional regulator